MHVGSFMQIMEMPSVRLVMVVMYTAHDVILVGYWSDVSVEQ